MRHEKVASGIGLSHAEVDRVAQLPVTVFHAHGMDAGRGDLSCRNNYAKRCLGHGAHRTQLGRADYGFCAGIKTCACDVHGNIGIGWRTVWVQRDESRCRGFRQHLPIYLVKIRRLFLLMQDFASIYIEAIFEGYARGIDSGAHQVTLYLRLAAKQTHNHLPSFLVHCRQAFA
jgi:hypothetical protein